MAEYADRDIMELDRNGGHYSRHVSAMTAEGLRSKADIAAELAWRDSEIARLRSESACTLQDRIDSQKRLAEKLTNMVMLAPLELVGATFSKDEMIEIGREEMLTSPLEEWIERLQRKLDSQQLGDDC